VSKNTKKIDRTQKVTENALPEQTPFPSFHINQILHVGLGSYPRYLSRFQVSLRSVEKCGSCGGGNFSLSIDLAHRFYNYRTSRDAYKDRRRPGRGQHYGSAVFPIETWNRYKAGAAGIAKTTKFS